MNIRHYAHRALLVVSALIFALPLALEAAKAVPVTVTAATPSAASQGDVKTIKITGTGFDNGSKASFLVSGTTDASQIVVTKVWFISSTELQADIQVQPSALTVSYDIAVVTSTGRKGKGTTLFKVNLDPSVILPVSLGVPTGCSNSLATGLNDGAYPAALTVTADTYTCTSGKDRPYRWQNGSWYNLGTLGAATSGITTGVSNSNDGKVVGWVTSSTGINTAFVVSGGIMTALPLLAGMVHAEAEGISEDGQSIFGSNSIEGETDAVRWKRDVGGIWNIEVIGVRQPGFRKALGSSDDGSILVGSGWAQTIPSVVYEGWVWVEGGSPAWVSLGAGTEAMDLDPTANMIVGYRTTSCGASCTTRIAVYWTLDGLGNWASQDLAPLDSTRNSLAMGVSTVNGKLVIVGYSNTQLTQEAVAWLPQAPGIYGPPTRLAAIDGNSSLGAQASDINANGVVAGWSGIPSGGNRRAVLWMLPTL